MGGRTSGNSSSTHPLQQAHTVKQSHKARMMLNSTPTLREGRFTTFTLPQQVGQLVQRRKTQIWSLLPREFINFTFCSNWIKKNRMGRQVFFFQVSVLIARQQNQASSWLHSSWPQITHFLLLMFLLKHKRWRILFPIFSHSPLLRPYLKGRVNPE